MLFRSGVPQFLEYLQIQQSCCFRYFENGVKPPQETMQICLEDLNRRDAASVKQGAEDGDIDDTLEYAIRYDIAATSCCIFDAEG